MTVSSLGVPKGTPREVQDSTDRTVHMVHMVPTTRFLIFFDYYRGLSSNTYNVG